MHLVTLRFKTIERTWSFLTDKISTVVIPDEIDGEKPKRYDEKSWLKVLNNAVEICSRFKITSLTMGFQSKSKGF